MTANHGATRYPRYGIKCADGDEIEMIVDFNALTIKYIIQGVDYGIAYKDIPVGKYRPLVHLHRAGACVQLLYHSVTM